MNAPAKAVQDAYGDLLRRSLDKIPGQLARLIYLASTRDYNTGTYHHDGLAARFQADAAARALELAHRAVFDQLCACSLEEIVGELQTYVNSSKQSRDEVVHVWQRLEPYRIVVPVDLHPAVTRLFVSNVKMALVILRHQAHTPALASP